MENEIDENGNNITIANALNVQMLKISDNISLIVRILNCDSHRRKMANGFISKR